MLRHSVMPSLQYSMADFVPGLHLLNLKQVEGTGLRLVLVKKQRWDFSVGFWSFPDSGREVNMHMVRNPERGAVQA